MVKDDCMVCMSYNCQEEASRNFISDSIVGKSVGQADIFSSITEWWNGLSDTYKYAIIGGGIAVVALIFGIALLPKKKVEVPVIAPPSATTKELEELLKLKLIKEIAK
jgi:hypothetical protein